MKRLSLVISFLLVALAACSEPPTTKVNPKLVVVATHVDENGNPLMDFGPVPVLLRKELVLGLENPSRAPLRIRTFELQDESGTFSLPDGLGEATIQGNESREIRVVFRPEGQEPFSGAILIESNDPLNESVLVGLEGEGSTIGRVEIEPDSIDFGVVGEWTQAVENVRIASVGTAPLLVESIEILEGSSAAFAVLGSTKPTELPPPRDGNPGGEVIVQVACAPTDAIEENDLSGTLRIRTTDPDRREVDIELRASVNRAPIAEFSIDPANHAPNLPIALDGTASFDPDGDEPLSFEWRVFDQPVGTTATFDDPHSPTPTLTVSQPGEYKIGLDVYDALGLPCRAPGGSELLPCKTRNLEIMAEDDLIVRLTWTHAVTDLDLHLLEGNSPLYSDGDCYWDNRTPDFGVPGDTGDDPRFTRESLKGFGPEEIVFSKPSGGSYTVAVEFAKANGAADPTTEAILEVYVFGKLEAQKRMTLTSPGQVWDVLSIDWPSAILTDIDEIREAVAR